MSELYECQSCSAKPGSPSLCETCLENRRRAGSAWIGPRTRTEPTAYDRAQAELVRRIEALEAEVKALKMSHRTRVASFYLNREPENLPPIDGQTAYSLQLASMHCPRCNGPCLGHNSLGEP